MKILSWQYAAQDPDTLWELLAESEQDQFSVMYEKLVEHREPAIRLAKDELVRTAAVNWTEEEKDAFARRQANAAAALFKLGAPDALWPLLAHRPDPRARSYIVHWLSRMGVGGPLHRARTSQTKTLNRKCLCVSTQTKGDRWSTCGAVERMWAFMSVFAHEARTCPGANEAGATRLASESSSSRRCMSERWVLNAVWFLFARR